MEFQNSNSVSIIKSISHSLNVEEIPDSDFQLHKLNQTNISMILINLSQYDGTFDVFFCLESDEHFYYFLSQNKLTLYNIENYLLRDWKGTCL